jgi:hypothetical protein
VLELFVTERLRINAEEIVYEHRSHSSNDCRTFSLPRPSAGNGKDLGTENIPCKASQRFARISHERTLLTRWYSQERAVIETEELADRLATGASDLPVDETSEET